MKLNKKQIGPTHALRNVIGIFHNFSGSGAGLHNFQSLKISIKTIKDQANQLNEAVSNLSKLEKESVKNFEEREAEIERKITRAEYHHKKMVRSIVICGDSLCSACGSIPC